MESVAMMFGTLAWRIDDHIHLTRKNFIQNVWMVFTQLAQRSGFDTVLGKETPGSASGEQLPSECLQTLGNRQCLSLIGIADRDNCTTCLLYTSRCV